MQQDRKATKIPQPTKQIVRGIAYARVRLTIDGERREFKLGRWGSPEADAEYRRIVTEWLATGRAPTPAIRSRQSNGEALIAELCLAYLKHREGSGVTDRALTKSDRPVLRRLRLAYGHTRVAEFTPDRLRAFLAAAITDCSEKGRGVGKPLSRRYVNQKILPIVKRMFRWGVVRGIVPPDVHTRLAAVESLRFRELDTTETQRIKPVPDDVVKRTIEHLTPTVAAMVKIQRLCAMRPGEVCAMTWAEIETAPEIWEYRPGKHKNAHRGHGRMVAIPKAAQMILMRFRDRDLSRPIFSPIDALREHQEARAAKRKTRPSCGNRPGSNRRAKPKRKPRDRYNTAAYAHAIKRAVKRAYRPEGVDDEAFAEWEPAEHWHPNQLRHAAVTQVEKLIGREAASAFAGHARLDTTAIYAHAREDIAREVAKKIG